MDIRVTEAAKRLGEIFPFEASVPLDSQRFGERTIRFLAPLHVVGSFTFDGKAYVVEARADTVLSSSCARCNRALEEPYGFTMSERFVKDGAVDGETYPYTGDHLALDQALMDNLFLHMPMVSLCKPDCKGLCPICGCDQNAQDCACNRQAAENPFSILTSLQEELKEV